VILSLLPILLSAAPIVLIDSVTNDNKAPPEIAAALEPMLCSTFEKAFKAVKVDVKCRADVQAILRLRALQNAVGTPNRCAEGSEKCAARMAKLVRCTHVLVATLDPAGDALKLNLNLVDLMGKSSATSSVTVKDLKGMVRFMEKVAPSITASLSSP
jgi:hypothetical protein